MDRRTADRPEQNRRRRLLRHRGDAADLPPLAVAGTDMQVQILGTAVDLVERG